MAASNGALAWENPNRHTEPVAKATPAPVITQKPTVVTPPPKLRVMPLLRSPLPRRFVRVPTHAVGVHSEQRDRPRAALRLPLKLRSVAGIKEEFPVTLVTR